MRITPSSSEVIASAPHHPLSGPPIEDLPSGTPVQQVSRPFASSLVSKSPPTQDGSHSAPDTPVPIPHSSNLRPSLSLPMFFSFQTKPIRAPMSRSNSEWQLRRGESNLLRSQDGQNVGGSRKLRRRVSMIDTTEARYAGEASVYYNDEVGIVSHIFARPRDVRGIRLT